jgi:thiol:disulfide interchange protein DsbD
MNPNNTQVLVKPQEADYDAVSYLAYLNEGLAEFAVNK